MKYPLFCMIFSRDHFRKVMYVFHVIDKTVMPSRNDPSFRPSARLRIQLDYVNILTFVYIILVQAVTINEILVVGKSM